MTLSIRPAANCNAQPHAPRSAALAVITVAQRHENLATPQLFRTDVLMTKGEVA